MNLNEFEKAKIAYNNMQFRDFDANELIKSFYNILNENKLEIEKVCEIEKKYNANLIDNLSDSLLFQKNNIKLERYIEQKKRDDGFIISKYNDSVGVIGVIFDSNIYAIIELLKQAVYTKNSLIFCTNNKLYGITNLIVIYFKEALKECGQEEDFVQTINSEDYLEMYNHNNILKKLIVVGNKNLQNKVLSKSRIEVITSGYNCFDIYIENIIDENLLKKILETKNIELNIYINKEVREKIQNLEIIDYTEVESIDECIRDIDINSAGYSSCIFTNDSNNANKFLKLVKSKNVFVNASATVERSFDIKEKDLMYTKQVMYVNK